jgi:hypothetical protein
MISTTAMASKNKTSLTKKQMEMQINNRSARATNKVL